MSDDVYSDSRIMPGECPIQFDPNILLKADLQSMKKADNGSRSPPNSNNDFLGNQQTASTEARASPNNSERFNGVTIDVQAKIVDGKARDAPDGQIKEKPPPLEVMGFVNPPNKIQNGECPMLFLSGNRDPDRKIVNTTPVKAETTDYGEYHFLQGHNDGRIETVSMSVFQVPEKDNSSDYYHLGGKYYKSETEYMYLNGKGDYIPMTDFLIKVESRVIEKDADGTTKDYISFKMYDADGWEQVEKIPYDKWSTLFAFIRSKAADRIIATDEISIQRFESLASVILRTSKIKTEFILNRWGWGELQSDGSRKFYHGGLKDCNSEKILPPAINNADKRREILEVALRIIEVGQREIIVVLLIYGVASYLDAIFTDAGYFLSLCLMLIGESGLMKTSVMRELFNVYMSKKDRLTSVRSTEASLHLMTEKAYDDILAVDDFNREGSQAEVKNKTKNIQTLCRTYSDKSPRAKYGGNNNVKKYAVRGGFVANGETAMTGELKSGSLRYLKLQLERRLDGTKLKQYQDNPEIMQTFYAEIIRFAERNYCALVQFVKNSFEYRRKVYEELQEPRLIDACVHLTLTADIVVKCLEETGAASSETAKVLTAVFKEDILKIIRKQSEETRVIEPHKVYVKEIWQLLSTGKIELAENVESYKENLQRYSGYVDKDVYMLDKDATYNKVLTAFRDRNEYLPIGLDEILSNLRKASSKLEDKSKGIHRPLMLALIVDECEKIANEGDG